MHIQPYLFFDGRSDEALDFYKKAVGAEVKVMMRFKDSPDQTMVSPGCAEKVMHAEFKIGDTTALISDGRNTGKPKFDGFALTILVNDTAEADRKFAALAEGGAVTMPLNKTFFSPRFGMLADKFGLNWIIVTQQS